MRDRTIKGGHHVWNLHRRRLGAVAAVVAAAMMIAASAATVAAPPPVYKYGKVTVSAGSFLDLDLGKKGFCDPSCDIGYWNAGGDSTSSLGPVDSGGRIGARIKKMGATKPTYLTCKNAKVGWIEYSRTRIPVGTWFCAKTDEGRVSRFRVTAITNPSVTIAYRTWTSPS
jgi:hypothetical protein